MKRRKLAVCALLAAALAGCTAGNPGESEPPARLPSNQGNGAAETVLAGDLSALQDYGGRVYGAVGADGFYYVTAVQSDDGSLLIHYLDYASMQDVPLCVQPNCRHEDETCTAWLPFTGGGTSLMAVGDKLVLAYPGNTAYQSQLGDICLPHIEVANLDGSDRKLLLSLDASQRPDTPYLTDGQNLFAKMNFVQDGTAKIGLVKINLEKGSCEPVVELDSSEGAILWGACGEYAIVRRNDPIDREAGVLGGTMNLYLDRINLRTGEREPVLQWNSAGDRAAVFGSSAIVYHENTNTLKQIDLLSNTVVNSYEEFLEPGYSPLSLNFIYLDGNQLLASCSKETEDHVIEEQNIWHVDMETGTKTPSQMYSVDPYTEKKISYLPLARIESEESYLVLTEETMQASEFYGGATKRKFQKIPFAEFWQ